MDHKNLKLVNVVTFNNELHYFSKKKHPKLLIELSFFFPFLLSSKFGATLFFQTLGEWDTVTVWSKVAWFSAGDSMNIINVCHLSPDSYRQCWHIPHLVCVWGGLQLQAYMFILCICLDIHCCFFPNPCFFQCFSLSPTPNALLKSYFSHSLSILWGLCVRELYRWWLL